MAQAVRRLPKILQTIGEHIGLNVRVCQKAKTHLVSESIIIPHPAPSDASIHVARSRPTGTYQASPIPESFTKHYPAFRNQQQESNTQ